MRDLLDFARANFAGSLQSRNQDGGGESPVARPDWLGDADVVAISPPPTFVPDVEIAGRRNARGELPIIYGNFQANPEDLKGREFDVLAYYLPFHFWDEASWGIYVREYGLELLATALNGGTIKPGDELIVAAAFEALFQHEFFHCLLESGATRVEGVTGKAAYRPHCVSTSARAHEEAVANASALRRFRRSFPHLGASWTLEAWMESQPNGYADFGKWVSAFKQAKQESAMHLVSAYARDKTTLPLPLEVLFGSVGARDVRTYLVRDGRGLIGLPFTFPRELGISVMMYTRDHRPPHLHVEIPSGSKARRVTWDDLLPLSTVESLSTKDTKVLRKYVDRHRPALDEFAKRVPWTA